MVKEKTYSLIDLINVSIKTNDNEKLISKKKLTDCEELNKSTNELISIINDIKVLDRYGLLNPFDLLMSKSSTYGGYYYTGNDITLGWLRSQAELVNKININSSLRKTRSILSEIFIKNCKIPEDIELVNIDKLYKEYKLTYRKYDSHYSEFTNKDHCYLSSIKNYFPDLIKTANNTKRFKLSTIKYLADTLGFIILPAKYLSDVAYNIDKTAINKVNNFKTDMDILCPKHVDYVLCPIIYLDLLKVSEEKDTYSRIWFSKKLNAISTSINMSIPVFRTMFSRLRTLEEKSEEHAKGIKECTDNISLIYTQLKEVNETISQTIQNVSKINEDISRINENVKALNKTTSNITSRLEAQEKKTEELWRCLMDPLYFTINNVDDIFSAKDDTTCYIGPCWGPEFPSDILNVFNN